MAQHAFLFAVNHINNHLFVEGLCSVDGIHLSWDELNIAGTLNGIADFAEDIDGFRSKTTFLPGFT